MLKSTGTNLQYSIARFLANQAIGPFSAFLRAKGHLARPKAVRKRIGQDYSFHQTNPIKNRWPLSPQGHTKTHKINQNPLSEPKPTKPNKKHILYY